MNQDSLQAIVSNLPGGQVRYFASIGSTNDEALLWAAQGAPDLSLVAADEQTAGRGRAGRKWFTPPGAALAFSVILRHPSGEQQAGDAPPSRTVGLAALAVADSLRTRSLAPLIKWPNDILIHGKKVGGILMESVWIGARPDFTIAGIGLNVSQAAVPAAELLSFPATSLEEASGRLFDRDDLLHDILRSLVRRRASLGTDQFIREWESLLAFRGQQVEVWEADRALETGKVLGLSGEGGLRLQDASGREKILNFGDLRVRPAA